MNDAMKAWWDQGDSYIELLPDEQRFRDIAKQREDEAWEQFHGDDDAPAVPGDGVPHGDMHPFDFRPDLECCSVSERQCWIDACLAAERGDPFARGNHCHVFDPDDRLVIGAMKTPWGIGSYVHRYGEESR